MSTNTCPVFRPSLEEFSVGIQSYIESIEPLVKPHGLCKVIPPQGWWEPPDYEQIVQISMKGDIPCPVKQCVSGARGCYALTLLETPPESLLSFKRKSDLNLIKKLPLNMCSSLIDDSTNSTLLKQKSNNHKLTNCVQNSLTPSPIQTQTIVNKDDMVEKRVRRFWKTLGPNMDPPMYGADALGTLFNGNDACGWNPDQLDSLLRRHCPPVSGVTSAMLYVGQWAAMFAYHVEDMNLYSVNYLHTGCPKSWYSIRPTDSARFESMAAALHPEDKQQCSEFLRHKRYLFSPGVLKDYGIVPDTLVHFPGEFVVTFPFSYHAGFNHGYNIAESSNFATDKWCEFAGKYAGVCHCFPDSVRIDLNDFRRRVRSRLAWSEATTDKNSLVTDDDAIITYSDTMKKKRRKGDLLSTRIVDMNSAVDSTPPLNPRVSIKPCSSKPLFLPLHHKVWIKKKRGLWTRGRIDAIAADGISFSVKYGNGVVEDSVAASRISTSPPPSGPPLLPSKSPAPVSSSNFSNSSKALSIRRTFKKKSALYSPINIIITNVDVTENR